MSLNSGLSQARQIIFPLCAFVTRRDWSEDASTAVAPLQQHNDTGGRLRLSHESGTPCQTMNVCIHDKRVLLLSRCSCDRPEGWWGVIFKPDVRGKYKFMLTFFEIDVFVHVSTCSERLERISEQTQAIFSVLTIIFQMVFHSFTWFLGYEQSGERPTFFLAGIHFPSHWSPSRCWLILSIAYIATMFS